MSFLRPSRDRRDSRSPSGAPRKHRLSRWLRGDDHDAAQTKPDSPEPLPTVQPENQRQLNDVDSFKEAKRNDAKRVVPNEGDLPISIWSRAYDALKDKDRDLVTKYEELLTISNQPGETNDPSHVNIIAQDDPPRRKAQMDEMMKTGQARAEEKKFRYRLFGAEHVLEDDIASAVNVVLWGKDWIGAAVQASPEASIVWAGVSAILPFLTNPSVSNKSNSEGFNYVTSRMDWYVTFEKLLLRALDDPRAEPMRKNFELHVQELYQAILEFQIQSILRLFQSRFKKLGKDMLLLDDWNAMANAVKSCEDLVDREARQIREALSLEGLREIRSSAREMENMMKKQFEYTMTARQAECHQIFRRIDSSNSADTLARPAGYEDYKERVEARVENTCQWFLDQNNFQHWLREDSSILLVTADPGCGKSVLAKYLIDHELIRRTSVLKKSVTICYFFFKDQIQSDINLALCALLHQLFSQNPFLIRHAMHAFDQDGSKLPHLTEKLWEIVQNAVADDEAGRVIFVLDALDECKDTDRETFTGRLRKYFQLDEKARGKLSVLLTSRPYEDTLSGLNELSSDFPNLRIPGEHESTKITEEINAVIIHRIRALEQRRGLKEGTLDFLKQRLLQIEHRTYLWMYLVFGHLEKEKLTDRSFQKNIIENVPKNFDEAYEKILSRSTNKRHAVRIFKILLAAFRPLTLGELQLAFEIDRTSSSLSDLDLDDASQFYNRLRDYCGLFVSTQNEKVYFLHQTTREFIISNVQPNQRPYEMTPVDGAFAHSISLPEAHLEMAHLCMSYLKFRNWRKDKLRMDVRRGIIHDRKHGAAQMSLLTYAGMEWVTHIRYADDLVDATTATEALEMCDVEVNDFYPWLDGPSGYPSLDLRWDQKTLGDDAQSTSELTVVAYFGLNAVMRHAIKYKIGSLRKADAWGRLPLHWAVSMGHIAVVRTILDESHTVEVSAKDDRRKTALIIAAREGYEAIVELLLTRSDLDINAKDEWGDTALIVAAEEGHEAVVRLLLDLGNYVDVNAKNKKGDTALILAAGNEHEDVVKLLLYSGNADVNAENDEGRTAFLEAARNETDAIVEILINACRLGVVSVDFNAKDRSGRSALFLAAMLGREKNVRLLLKQKDIDVDARYVLGISPLQTAVAGGYPSIVRMLLKTGQVDIGRRDRRSADVLWSAALGGNEEIIQTLVKTGKLKVSTWERGRALEMAIRKGHEAAAKLIQDIEVDPEAPEPDEADDDSSESHLSA